MTRREPLKPRIPGQNPELRASYDRKGVHYASWVDYQTFEVAPPERCPHCASVLIAKVQSFVLYYPSGFPPRFFWFCPEFECRREWEATKARGART